MKKNNINKKNEKLISFYNDKIIVDTLLVAGTTKYIIYDRKDKSISVKNDITINWIEYYPINANSSFITSWSVLFPSEISYYWTEIDLLKSIEDYLYKYIDIPPEYIIISSYYILLTYIYPNFTEIPYLRVIWDYWSGKSRLLKTIWSICYNPIITNWWTSLSAIFRMIGIFKWTLILDEADFSYSDTTSDMIKLLNNGYQKWNSIMRAYLEWFEPNCYEIYCPKIIWGRMEFRDKATESRCLTNVMKKTKRKDILFWLDKTFDKEALELRNKLLKYRYDNFWNKKLKNKNIEWIEPRLNQIINPILSLVKSKKAEEIIIRSIRSKQDEIKVERKNSLFWAVLWILKNSFEKSDEVYLMYILEQLEIIEWKFNFNARKLWSLLKQNWIKSHRKNNWTVIRRSENENELDSIFNEYST